MRSRNLLARIRKEKKRGAVDQRVAEEMTAHGNGASSPRATRQPFSDGSEEFMEQFAPQYQTNRLSSKKDLLLGLGLTVGLLAGVGVTLLLVKQKSGKPWWRKLLEK